MSYKIELTPGRVTVIRQPQKIVDGEVLKGRKHRAVVAIGDLQDVDSVAEFERKAIDLCADAIGKTDAKAIRAMFRRCHADTPKELIDAVKAQRQADKEAIAQAVAEIQATSEKIKRAVDAAVTGGNSD